MTLPFSSSSIVQVDEESGPLEAKCVWGDTGSLSLSCSTGTTEVGPLGSPSRIGCQNDQPIVIVNTGQ